MVHNAEALTGPVWADPNDPRVTNSGRFLRATHLDEFPQLYNVLLGQMSLIGPRPERPEFVTHLEWDLPNYRDRLKVRPGITGLAQLLLPPDSNLESVRRKLVHDLYYVRHVGPSLDFRIAVFTVCYLMRAVGSNCLRGLRLPSQDVIESSIILELRPDCADVIAADFSEI
jgi:lipopolysaccharide/colanic/teichoic acid biosynthesis glycosyltransferase